MSSYLLSDSNLSFIADGLIDIDRMERFSKTVYPLISCRVITRNDRISKTEAKKDLFKALKKLNLEALNERYGDEVAEEITGYTNLCKDYMLNYNNRKKFLFTLAGVIDCYLYQCSEGDIPESDLFRAIQLVRGNIYKKIAFTYSGYEGTDGWSSVDDLGLEDEDATNNAIDIFDFL